jgi:hypothetical protein
MQHQPKEGNGAITNIKVSVFVIGWEKVANYYPVLLLNLW